MSSIFLSYSSEDRAIARKLVAALEAGGFSVWWDGLLEGGERFAAAIEAALDQAAVVVVVWSKASVGSHWVQDEAARGRDSGRLVPVSIDGVRPPLGFGQLQAIDLTNWKGAPDAPVIADLSKAIALKSGSSRIEPARRTTIPSRRRVLIGAGAGVIAGGGALAAWKFWPAAIPTTTSSIAVLPFRNLSGDAAQDYFAAGIAEEVRNTLARSPLLKVIATTTSNTFRGHSEALPDVAKRLDVSFVLDGSVRQAGETVRIAVQLIDGASGATRWTETFDKPFNQVLLAQSEIATAVLQLLNIQISGAGYSGDLRQTGGTDNPAAFDAFMRGRAEFEHFNTAGFRAAARLYAEASSLDPGYAAAYSGEARCFANLSTESEGDLGFQAAMDRAVSLARKAHSLAPESAFVNIVLGATLANDLQFREAREYYDAANRISPRHLDVPTLYGLYQAYLGKFVEARQAIDRAISVDRLNPRVWLGKLWIHYWAGEYEEALDATERIWSENPKFGSPEARSYFGFVCNLELGRYDRARKHALAVGEKLEREWELAIVAQRDGDPEPGLGWLEQVERDQAYGANIANNRVALLAQLGRPVEALTALEAEFARGNPNLMRIQVDPLLKPLAAEPRFKALIERIGLTG